MKNSLENNEFEDQWQKAFDAKELTPSDGVWSGIDAHLANQAAGSYKRTALFYRWVAAASVLLLLGWTGYYLSNKTSDSTLTENSTALNEEGSKPEIQEMPSVENKNKTGDENIERIEQSENDGQLADNTASSGINNSGKNNPDKTGNSPKTPSAQSENPRSSVTPESRDQNDKSMISPLAVVIDQEHDESITQLQDQISVSEYANSTHSQNSSTALLLNANPKGFDLLLAAEPGLEPEAIPVWDFEIKDKKKNDPEAIFAGLNFSPGMFDPNFSNSTVAANNLSAASFDMPVSNSVAESDVNQGFSYGFGVNGGVPVGKKWVIQGGLEYSVGRSETSTSLIVESASGDRSVLTFTNSDEAEAFDNSVSISSPTDVTSSYQFISVPIKAGYSILNKQKFGLMISGGVSSDFFLSNTISSSQQGIDSFKQSSGSDSPFKSVYFSGLSSVTLTYKVSSNYLILLEPSFKAALNDFSKSSELFNSRPNSFGIGVGVRYRFK